MSEYFKNYLKNINFEKTLVSLKKKLKNKPIIIYGTGLLFQYINENYDLSDLNIIGISDIKYASELEGNKDLGYNIIPKGSIPKYDPDYVLVASENYMGLIESLNMEFSSYHSIKFLPLARKNWLEIVKAIWQIA